MGNVTVILNEARQHTFSAGVKDLCRLVPGKNVIDRELWDKVYKANEKEEDSTLMAMIEEGTIMIASKEGGELGVSELKKVIDAEGDLDVLATMLEEENARQPKPRSTIVKALENKIAAIEAALEAETDAADQSG